MNSVSVIKDGGLAIVTMERGKVNALNPELVEELSATFSDLGKDDGIRVVLFTGRGKFFSFGFDIPEFMASSRDKFTTFLIQFTNLYTEMFLFPKPLIASINGHAIAGGCMLATACDYRIMVAGRSKIGVNELAFGSTVFAGSVEMLKFCVGQRNAGTILYSSQLYSGSEAMGLGLVDRMSTSLDLMRDTREVAHIFALKQPDAFKSIKGLLRNPVREAMIKKESHSIHKFVDIWCSEATMSNLKEIKIPD